MWVNVPLTVLNYPADNASIMTVVPLRLFTVYLQCSRLCKLLMSMTLDDPTKNLPSCDCYYSYFTEGDHEARKFRYHMESHTVRKG